MVDVLCFKCTGELVRLQIPRDDHKMVLCDLIDREELVDDAFGYTKAELFENCLDNAQNGTDETVCMSLEFYYIKALELAKDLGKTVPRKICRSIRRHIHKDARLYGYAVGDLP